MILGEQESGSAKATASSTAGLPHQLINESDEPLVLLCCCSPPYTHEDTVLV